MARAFFRSAYANSPTSFGNSAMMSAPNRLARAVCGPSKVAPIKASTAVTLKNAAACFEIVAARIPNFMSLSCQISGAALALCADGARGFRQALAQRSALGSHGRYVPCIGDAVQIDLHIRQSSSCAGGGHQPRHFPV